MRWACLLLPQLALDGAQRRMRSSDQPLVLVEGPAQRRVLHSVNAAARAQGLRPGLTLAAAQALGATAVTAGYDAAEVERSRALLASWAYRFSSQVSTDLPHAIVLEVAHSLQLFGPWPQLETRLRSELRELGFRHRIVAAPNPHAARVLANVRDGLAVDDSGLFAALGDVPVERAGLPRTTVHSLSRMGLRKLRQLFALPRDAVARRFPDEVLRQLDVLRGEPAPLRLYRPPEHFEARIEFEYEVESSQALLFPLRRLTADLAAFLAGRDGGVQRFHLVLEHERVPDSKVIVGLLAAERDAAMLFELARGRIEQARVPAPVQGMQLLAHELPPFVPAAADLFDARAQQALPWPQLRERLRARLGDTAVRGVGLRADHRPEYVANAPAIAASQGDALCALPRPGWLLPEAVPLRDRRLRVLAGPERIESGWWDGFDMRRDYYLVETSQGQRGWAFTMRDSTAPPDGAWMLHGWFA